MHCPKHSFSIDNEYFPNLNRKNEAMPRVEKLDCERTDNLVVNDHTNLGE